MHTAFQSSLMEGNMAKKAVKKVAKAKKTVKKAAKTAVKKLSLIHI